MFKKLFSLDTNKDFVNHYFRHPETYVTLNIEEDREDDIEKMQLFVHHLTGGKWEEVFRVFYPASVTLSDDLIQDLLSKAVTIVYPWDEYILKPEPQVCFPEIKE